MSSISPLQQSPQEPQLQHVQAAPVHRANFPTNRSLTKFILLGIITLGIYQIYVITRAGEDLNAIASRYDNKRTMNYWLVALLLGWLTLGIIRLAYARHHAVRLVARHIEQNRQ